MAFLLRDYDESIKLFVHLFEQTAEFTWHKMLGNYYYSYPVQKEEAANAFALGSMDYLVIFANETLPSASPIRHFVPQ